MAEIAEHKDPFEQFESVAELLAYWARKYGEQGFRELLTQLVGELMPAKAPWLLTSEERNGITTTEQLEKYASDLESHGLRTLATIVRQHGADRPSQLQLCPYAPGTANARAWYFREYQKLGLCPWCGSDKSPEAICDNGDPCLVRWHTRRRAPRPT